MKRLLCFAFLLTLTPSLQAGVLTGVGGAPTDSIFTSAAPADVTTFGFNTVAAGDYATLSLGDVDFIGVDGPLTVSGAFNGGFNSNGGQHIENGADGVPASFRFNFNSAIAAFAFNIGASDTEWTLSAFDSGDNLIASFVDAPLIGSNAGDYIGIDGMGTNIAYATLIQTSGLTSNDYILIDDFTTLAASTAGVVPEPTSLATWGLLVGAVAAVRRRRK